MISTNPTDLLRSSLLTALLALAAAGCSNGATTGPDASQPGGADATASASDATATVSDAAVVSKPDASTATVDASASATASDAEVVDSADASTASPDAGQAAEPRLVAMSREGKVASLQVVEPFTVKATGDLGAAVGSAKCLGSRCVAVHPTPDDKLTVFDARTLEVTAEIALESGADPRDVTLVDDHTAVVSQFERAALLEVDLVTKAKTPIDLAVLADSDGQPEADRLTSCGRRVFVQLRRDDHANPGIPSALPAVLAVVDLDKSGAERVVDADPATQGVQGIVLAVRPKFDMPVDCAAGMLYVSEPRPLMQGGSGYEKVDLKTLKAADYDIDTGAEGGGFEVLTETNYWIITHTEFGPGPSSHLNCVGGTRDETWNTFASEHVDDLALDRVGDLLFYPDPCSTISNNASCENGIHVFHAHSGELATTPVVSLGFAPIEVALAR
ncbi:MAG: hypothetical protein QM765_26160 [Myxococcales bacterium]